jgi:hypothetical protein
MEGNMDANAATKKPSILKRVFYIVLIVLAIILFLEATLGTMLGVKGTEYFAETQLQKERYLATNLANFILLDHLQAPGHQLWLFQTAGMASDRMTILAKEYPEIFGVYLVGKNGKTTPLLQGYPSAQIQEKVISLIPSIMDSANFATTYWDSTWKRDLQWRDVTQRPYFFGSFQTDDGTYVVVMDIEKLKSQLPAIFDQGQKRLGIFAKYFLPVPRLGAQIKFFGSNGDNFYTLGNPKGQGWDQIYDLELPYLPWKMSVQIFPKDTRLIALADAMGKTPWQPLIPFIIGIICILVLGWTARKSWWY